VQEAMQSNAAGIDSFARRDALDMKMLCAHPSPPQHPASNALAWTAEPTRHQ
jgi:hypothetical protein